MGDGGRKSAWLQPPFHLINDIEYNKMSDIVSVGEILEVENKYFHNFFVCFVLLILQFSQDTMIIFYV